MISQVEYFASADLSGSPALVRIDPQVVFNWVDGSPDAFINSDYFSARWTGQIEPRTSSDYTFHVYTDDGLRLWVNGQLLIDDWVAAAGDRYSSPIQLQAGQLYDIRLDYFEEAGGAAAFLYWSDSTGFINDELVPGSQLYPASLPPTSTATPTDTPTPTVTPTPTATPTPLPPGTGVGLAAEYFASADLSGSPALVRIDPQINFDWGAGSAHPLLGDDNHSIRWTGQIEPRTSALYDFEVDADGGVRLWVDNQLLIDDWNDPNEFLDRYGSVQLQAGVRYDIRLEYFDSVGASQVTLRWSDSTGFIDGEVVPGSQLYPADLPPTATTIDYVYDSLYRLKEANYSDGRYFHYTYDAAGNRLSETECPAWPCPSPTVTNYSYDSANRLTNVNGQTYTWDANGNLLNDGVSTYAYDAANRLTSVMSGSTTSTYTYSGLGDRLSQTVNSVTTNYVLDLNAGLTQVLADGSNIYLYGNGRIGELQPGGFAYHLGDALGSVRQLVDASATVTLAKSYEPYGNTLTNAGSGNSVFQFTGEARDSYIKLLYLRSRWLSTDLGRFTSKDTWRDYSRPFSLNGWNYVNANPINWVDPSGYTPQCPIDRWDCEAVQNVSALKQAFLDSAGRHNKIPTMDKNGFAGLLAAVIVSERRIGNVPPDSDDRNRKSQWREDLVASFGCTVSGIYIKAAVDEGDYGQAWRYFTNQDVPQRATVGIGNVWLETAANVWKGQACSSLGDCIAVQVSKLQTTNVFGVTVDINNPFGTQVACAYGTCTDYQPTETESYMKLTTQLLSREMNIEYVAANLEAGALRAIAKGFQPSAFNSATWHLKGVQTDKEIGDSSWNPGGAISILDDIPTALTVLGITSSWNVGLEPQYATWKNP